MFLTEFHHFVSGAKKNQTLHILHYTLYIMYYSTDRAGCSILFILTGSPGDPFSPGLPGRPCIWGKGKELYFISMVNRLITTYTTEMSSKLEIKEKSPQVVVVLFIHF